MQEKQQQDQPIKYTDQGAEGPVPGAKGRDLNLDPTTSPATSAHEDAPVEQGRAASGSPELGDADDADDDME